MTRADRNNLILQWQEVSSTLAFVKEREAELRKAVLKEFFDFDAEALREGTENSELGNGYKLKATFETNYILAAIDDVKYALSTLRSEFNDGGFVGNRLVSWKPNLSISEYKKLDGDMKAIFDNVVTSKPAMPTLQLIEPKAKK